MARRKWSAEEKQKIVLAGLKNETSVAELCRRYGASDVMFYKWKKTFLSKVMGSGLVPCIGCFLAIYLLQNSESL